MCRHPFSFTGSVTVHCIQSINLRVGAFSPCFTSLIRPRRSCAHRSVGNVEARRRGGARPTVPTRPARHRGCRQHRRDLTQPPPQPTMAKANSAPTPAQLFSPTPKSIKPTTTPVPKSMLSVVVKLKPRRVYCPDHCMSYSDSQKTRVLAIVDSERPFWAPGNGENWGKEGGRGSGVVTPLWGRQSTNLSAIAETPTAGP